MQLHLCGGGIGGEGNGCDVPLFGLVGEQVEQLAGPVEFEALVEGIFPHSQILALARRIPGVEPVARFAGFVAKLRQKAHAINGRGHFDTGGGADGGQEVGAADEIGADAAFFDHRRPARDERDVRAMRIRRALATFVVPPFELAGDPAVRPVVAEEEQQRVVANAEFVEFRHDASHHLVHVGGHVGEMLRGLLLVFTVGLRIPVRAVGRRLKRVVGEDHRVIEEERLLLVFGNEFQGEVVDQLRAVLAVVEVFFDAVVFQIRVRIARRAARLLPEAGLVEPEVLRRIDLMPELPFAANSGGIARVLHEMPEGCLRAQQRAKVDVVPHVVAPRHELHPRRRAKRLHVAVFKTHTVGGEFVDDGRLIRLAAVRGDALVAEVIDHDEDDVGPLRGE